MIFKAFFLALPLAMLTACGSEDGGNAGDRDPSPTTAQAPVKTPAVVADTAPAAFATCRSCHSVEPGKHGIGPSLFGIVGTKAGGIPGFNFSPALRNSGVTWDRQSLDTWLQGPMKMVPGTRMVIGVSDPKKRQEVIDYLETLK